MATRKKDLDITNRKSIQNMITYIENYKKDFPEKMKQFVSELADVGIQVADTSTTVGLGKYIIFSKELKSLDNNECYMIMYGRDISSVVGEGIDAAEISPILMEEYGSGKRGVAPRTVDNLVVGQGTFPGQKHAFDPNGWYYLTKNGQWKHSYGITPTYPMQKAYDYMQTQVDSIARRVFGF